MSYFFFFVGFLDGFVIWFLSFAISSRRVAWFMDKCWILSLRSENASLSISMSFFTLAKLAETFFSI